jgi:type II secretory pathway pseudopilin PulG
VRRRVVALVRDERGITLAEILAAMVIIGIGLVGLMVVIPVSTYGVQEGKQTSTATFLAEQRLEEVRHAAWQGAPSNDCLGLSSGNAAPTSTSCSRVATPTLTACAPGAACTTFPNESSVAGSPGYSRQVRISTWGTASSPGCPDTIPTEFQQRLVTVTVSYTPLTAVGVATTRKSVSLDMLIAKRC